MTAGDEASPWALAASRGLLLTVSGFGIGPSLRDKPRWKVSVYRDPFQPGHYVYAHGYATPDGVEALIRECVAEAVRLLDEGDPAGGSTDTGQKAAANAEDMGLF